MFVLASGTVAGLSIQWGNFVWPMIVIWTLGSAIIWRLRRFHISATYVVSFLAFALLRSWITGDPWRSEISPITGPMYQLFIFFMITDPKTTVRSKTGQCLVVVCRGCGRDGAAPAPGGVCSVLCPLPSGAHGHASGDVDGLAPCPPPGRTCLNSKLRAVLFSVCCCSIIMLVAASTAAAFRPHSFRRRHRCVRHFLSPPQRRLWQEIPSRDDGERRLCAGLRQ